MTVKTSYHVNKESWGLGAWQGEPDKMQWIDPSSGLDCLIVRGPSGALCGYVGIPPVHPFYEQVDFEQLRVHGGVTFTGKCTADEHGICHKHPFASKDVWWIGFDCAHAGDITPAHLGNYYYHMFEADTYKTIDYVKKEVEDLAKQLREIK